MNGLSDRLKRQTILRRSAAAIFLFGVIGHAHRAMAQSTPADDTDIAARLDQLTIENQQLAAQNRMLVQLLVQNKVLSRSQAQPLLRTATLPPPVPYAPTAMAAPPPPGPAEPIPPPGTVRVAYVPQFVRDQIATQVRQEVLAQEQAQNYAAPNALPEWTKRVTISGDIRLRAQRDLFDQGNSPDFVNFNSINNSANGFDTSSNNTGLPPLLNTTQDRSLFELRARLDVAAQISDWMTADIRIGTGNSTTPVSLNQTLGSPGDFQKYAIYLDRAYIGMTPTSWLTIDAGRMPNPFWTTNLTFDDNVNFDGLATKFDVPLSPTVDAFLNAGAFPVFNTTFNLTTASDGVGQANSHDAYLFAAQAGAAWQANDDLAAKLGVAFFDYSNVQGKLSDPCFDPTGVGGCDTDDTKPPFLQQGNTVFPIRDIVSNGSTDNPATPEFFGLASRFDVLDVHGQTVLTNFHPIDIVIDGDFIKNLGFNRKAIAAEAVNNLGPNGAFQGGDTGYQVSLQVGYRQLEKLWDWNASVAYKYLESDATPDAFTDSDFHLGGTNAKGYILRANLGLDANSWIAASFFATNEVSGPPYGEDTAQLDLNAKF
jgi:hypothetical protein